MSKEIKPKSLLQSFLNGILLKCPFCCQGALFKSYLKIASKCAKCHHSFEKADTGDGPAFFVMSIVSTISVIVLLIIELSYSPAIWIHVLVQLSIILGLSFMLLPLVKSLLVHFQYYFNAIESYHK